MIQPNRHTDPDLTVLNVASIILKKLKRTNIKTFTELSNIVYVDNPSADKLFLPSLQFLFLLGLIEYHPKNDSIEYLKKDEAK